MVIESVSDTARWVAVYRAMETERPDALFRDPWARTLAGSLGQAIVDGVPRGRQTAWAMIVRTAVFDEIISTLTRDGSVDLVLNLAAGLDTRPWRLDLPAELRWVDVDLPEILRHKTDTLQSETPRCHYEALHADLTHETTRRRTIDQVTASARCALVVTEGLLIYLDPADVAALASDLHAAPSVRWWLTDLASPRLLAMMKRSWGKQLDSGRAPFRFAPGESTGFFEPYGWKEKEWRSTWTESERLDRQMPMAWLWRFLARLQSKRKRDAMLRFSGYPLLERA